MTFSLPWPDRRTSENISALEARLQRVFVPVQPRAGYAGELRAALQREAHLPPPEKAFDKNFQIILIGGASILSGVLVILTGVRTMIAILGALGIYQQVKGQLKKPLPRPLRLAG